MAAGRVLPSARELGQISLTFTMAVIAWVFFRSTNLGEAFTILKKILFEIFSIPQVFPKGVFVLILVFVVVEWIGRSYEFGFQVIQSVSSRSLRLVSYYAIIIFVLYNAVSEVDFIYFQF